MTHLIADWWWHSAEGDAYISEARDEFAWLCPTCGKRKKVKVVAAAGPTIADPQKCSNGHEVRLVDGVLKKG